MMENDGQLDRWTNGQKTEEQWNLAPMSILGAADFMTIPQNFISLSSLVFSRLFIFVGCVFQNPKRVGKTNVVPKCWEEMGLGLATTSQMRVSPRSLSFLEISIFSFFLIDGT